MNNIASLEDFLNQATGVGSSFPLANIQRQSTAPSIGSQHPVTPSQLICNENNSTDKAQEEFNDTSINQYMASVTSDAINENPTKNHSDNNLVADSNSQHEHLRKELLSFCSKTLQEIKQEIKKSVSQQNQRLNNVEQKVASVNYSKQSAADNKQCVTKKENKIEFVEHKKQLIELKCNPGQIDQDKIQSDQLSSTEAKTLRTDLLNIFSRSVQEIKESNIYEFAEHKKKISDLQTKVDKANKNQTTIQNTNINPDYKTEIINVFGKSLHEVKVFNKSEFAKISKKLNEKLDCRNSVIQTMQAKIDEIDKKFNSQSNKTEFVITNKKLYDKLDNQNSVIHTMQAKIDKINKKLNSQSTEINSLRAELGKEKKKRITLTERFGKNITELNLLKQQIQSDEKPSVDLFSDNESTFSMSSNNSKQNKSITASTISLSLSNDRETKLSSSQVLSTKDLEDNNEACDTYPTAPGIHSPTPRRLSSASGSVTSLASNESELTNPDKAQLYLQQMTISSSKVSLNQEVTTSSNVPSDEGNINSSNVPSDEGNINSSNVPSDEGNINSSNVPSDEGNINSLNVSLNQGGISSSNVSLNEERSKQVGVEIKNNNKKLIQYDRDFLLKFAPICTSKPAGLPNIDVVLDQAHAPTKALIPGQIKFDEINLLRNVYHVAAFLIRNREEQESFSRLVCRDFVQQFIQDFAQESRF